MAAMTRQELLKTLILQAKKNGFEFRKWYLQHLESSWIDFEASVATLSRGKRYYAMLFSHAFARHFWNPGGQMTFMVPTSTYIRHNKDGKLTSVTRKAYTRRTLKPDAWRYHLREMAASEDALQYIRRFIVRQEDVDHQQTARGLHAAAPPESDHLRSVLPPPPGDLSGPPGRLTLPGAADNAGAPYNAGAPITINRNGKGDSSGRVPCPADKQRAVPRSHTV